MQPTAVLRTLAISLSLGLAGLPAQAADDTATPTPATAQMQHIRNATSKIDYAGKVFLIDPLLAKKGAYPGFEGTVRSDRRNPMVELPMPAPEVLKGVDAVIVTHTHLDHSPLAKALQRGHAAPQQRADAEQQQQRGRRRQEKQRWIAHVRRCEGTRRT